MRPIKLLKPLHAALLISPWISFDTSEPSFKMHENSDYITTTALERASMAYLALGSAHDDYSQPSTASVEWWREVAETAVANLLIWGGGAEILIDGITKFASRVEAGFWEGGNGAGFGFVITPNQAHEEMIIDTMLLMGRKGEGGLAVEQWLGDVLRSGASSEFGNQDI